MELQQRCSIRDWIFEEESIGGMICLNFIRLRCSIRDWIFEEGWVIMW